MAKTTDPLGAPLADDVATDQQPRKAMHLKRSDPRAAAIEGKPKFKGVNSETGERTSDTRQRRR